MTVRVKLWKILQEQEVSPRDLMYGARIAQGTAYRLADKEKCQDIKLLDLDVTEKVINFLGIGIEDVLEVVEEEQS